MSPHMNQIDPSDQHAADDEGRGDTLELGSQVGIQFHPPEGRMSEDVELGLKQNAAPPVHSLPVELLLQVVHHTLRPFLQNNKSGYYRHLISLSGVCSHWYSVIRDSPPLWTQIHASDSPNFIEMALRRSSSHVIDITCHKYTSPGRDPENIQKFLDTIFLHRNRWRTLDVITACSWMSYLTTALEGSAPSLEKLSLTDQDTLSSALEVDLFGGTAPQLKDLTLNGVSTRWDGELVHGLKLIDLSYIDFPSTKTVLDILSHSPQLQQATVWRCSTRSISTDSSHSIRLSQLSILRMDLGSLEAIDNILDSLKVAEWSSLSIPLLTGEHVGGFLQSRVAGWTSNWNVTAMLQLGGLLLEIEPNNLRMGIVTPSYPEPLTIAVEVLRTEGTEFLLALSSIVDKLASWAKGSATIHLKLGYSPFIYPFNRVDTRQLFVNELSRLPPITSLEISSVENNSLVNILIREGASSFFRNVSTLSFSAISASDLQLDFVSPIVRSIKAATEIPLDELDRKRNLQKVELRVPVDGSAEPIVKELEGIVGPGKVFVFNIDSDNLL